MRRNPGEAVNKEIREGLLSKSFSSVEEMIDDLHKPFKRAHPKKTMEVARELGVIYWRLVYLLRSGKIPAPKKDASGDLIWTKRDVSNAKKALINLRHYKQRQPGG